MACDTASDNLFPFSLSNVYWSSAVLVDTSAHPGADVYARIISFIQQSIQFLQALWNWLSLRTRQRLKKKRKTAPDICALLFFSVGSQRVVVRPPLHLKFGVKFLSFFNIFLLHDWKQWTDRLTCSVSEGWLKWMTMVTTGHKRDKKKETLPNVLPRNPSDLIYLLFLCDNPQIETTENHKYHQPLRD